MNRPRCFARRSRIWIRESRGTPRIRRWISTGSSVGGTTRRIASSPAVRTFRGCRRRWIDMSVSNRFRSSKQILRDRSSGYRSVSPMISDSRPISEKNSSQRAMSSSSEYSASLRFLPFALPGVGSPERDGSSPIICYLSSPRIVSFRVHLHGGMNAFPLEARESPARGVAARHACDAPIPMDEPSPALRAAPVRENLSQGLRGRRVHDGAVDHRDVEVVRPSIGSSGGGDRKCLSHRVPPSLHVY